jgi:hypothetical protein
MEKNYHSLIAAVTITLVAITSCNKNERAYHRIIEDGRWVITTLSSGTTNHTKLPKWQIYPCDDHENYCRATWEHQNGSSSDFYWRFTNLGGDFDFYVDSLGSETQTMAFAQCANFSGEYDVTETKRHLFRFESYSTTGYPNQPVIIQIEKQ